MPYTLQCPDDAFFLPSDTLPHASLPLFDVSAVLCPHSNREKRLFPFIGNIYKKPMNLPKACLPARDTDFSESAYLHFSIENQHYVLEDIDISRNEHT